MQIFQHDGNCIFTGVWTAITAAKSFDATLLAIPAGATHFVRYTTGGTAALILNETITGGTSSKTCLLVAQAVEVGTAGSSDTGILFVKKPSGTFQAETLTGAVSSGTVAIIQDLIPLPAGAVHPKTLLIQVLTAALNVNIGGVKAATTATNNYGVTLDAGQSRVIRGVNNIRSFQAINAVGSNGAVMKYELYY